MTESIVLNPVVDTTFAIAVLIILTAVLVWKEFSIKSPEVGKSGRNTLSIVVRVFAILLVAMGMFGILFQPSFRWESTLTTVLLTKGFDRSKADSVRSQNARTKILSAPDAGRYPGASTIHSLHDLCYPADAPDIILGEGLPSYLIDEFGKGSYSYIPSQAHTGLIQLAIPEPLYAGKHYVISGVYYADRKKDLSVSSPAGREDSVQLRAGKNYFRLAFTPSVAGLADYVITVSDSLQREEHPVPLQIHEPEKLSILLLQRYPTFEGLYLKNYLGRNNAVTIRHQLSRNIFRYEYIHTGVRRFDRLSTEELATIDLVLMDSETFLALSEQERSALERSIREGLGCLLTVTVPDPRIKSFLSVTFTPSRSDDTVRLTLPGGKLLVLQKQPVEIQKTSAITPTLEHGQTHVSGYVNKGFGRLGFTLLRDTYPLLLRGDSGAYAQVWSETIEHVARKRRRSTAITFPGSFPYAVDQPVPLRIKSSVPSPRIYFNSVLLPLKEDAVIDGIWHTTLWPDSTGWNRIFVENDSAYYPFYVHPEGELSSLRSAQRSYYTATNSAHHPQRTRRSASRTPVNPVWFYVLFMVGMSCLWLWPRL